MPTLTLGLAEVTSMLVNVDDDTVSPVEPVLLTPASVIAALIVVEPALMGVNSPLEPAALLMVATALPADFHVTWVVRSWVDASEKVPVAVN